MQSLPLVENKSNNDRKESGKIKMVGASDVQRSNQLHNSEVSVKHEGKPLLLKVLPLGDTGHRLGTSWLTTMGREQSAAGKVSRSHLRVTVSLLGSLVFNNGLNMLI